MTRKDYVAIATAFKMVSNTMDRTSDDWQLLRQLIGDAFELDNARFDRERFYTACEVTP